MASFTANGKTYELVSDFTVDEMCAAEEAFDIEFGNPRYTMRIGRALIWLTIRRDTPDVRPDDIKGVALNDDEGDADPPALENGRGSATSGVSTEPISAGREEDQSPTGDPGSDISADLARQTFFNSLQSS